MKKITALVCSLLISSYACATVQLDVHARYNAQDFSTVAVVENGTTTCMLGELRFDALVQEVENGISVNASVVRVADNALLSNPVLIIQPDKPASLVFKDKDGNEVLALDITPHVIAE